MNAESVHRSTNRRALLIFVVVLALVVSAIGLGVGVLQTRYVRDAARAQFQTELALLGELAVEPLLRSDYAAVERLVQAWVRRRDYALQISAVTPNGFVLASAQNHPPLSAPLAVEQPVVFGAHKLLVLRAVADVAARERGVSAIARNAVLIAVAIVSLLGWVLWGVLQRTAIRPLEAEIDTRERQARELQQRGAALEAAIRELEAFSYSVSHDLRAPLRAMDGYCQALSEDYAPVLDAAAQQYLARARAAAQRMGLLIDDLLGLARMSRHDVHLQEVDLSALARDVVERLSQEEPARQVTVSIAAGLCARADAQLMSVAFENLIGNAWKYTARTPNPVIEFGRTTHDGAAAYFVRDNGVGFDMQYAGKLFQPFQRLHGAEYAGSGVGLATVQRVIARHGGQVWAESQPNHGATFYFTLSPAPPGA